MRVNTQRGSIVSFIIMALVLVFIAGGAIYLARSYSDAGQGAEVATTDEPAKPENNDAPKPADDTPTPEQDEKDPAPTNRPEAMPAPNSNDTSNDADQQPPADVDQYSQTGPAETMMQVVAAGALTATGAAYVASRRRASL